MMEGYTIYCTKEQAEKAFQLGAPIIFLDKYPMSIRVSTNERHIDEGYVLAIPTAEQMIGWLEENGIKEVTINGTNDNRWRYDVWIEYGCKPICSCPEGYTSRKEATLAGINVALDYLKYNKEE